MEWICSGVVKGSNVVVDLLWVFWILLLWVWLGFVVSDNGGFWYGVDLQWSGGGGFAMGFLDLGGKIGF